MNSKNYEQVSHFIEGLKGDFTENTESNKSYNKGVNGRLYSHNGVLSFSSVKGTKKVYENPSIVSYLGSWAFQDELIVFVKCSATSLGEQDIPGIIFEEEKRLIANSFSVSSDQDIITVNLEPEVNEITISVPVFTAADNSLNFTLPLSCIDTQGNEIDFSEYYTESLSPVTQTCSLINGASFENNTNYIDCIFSLKKDSSGNLFDNLLWTGLLNWPEDAKITTYGLFENNFYKRVYFTDHVTPFKVINIKDTSLSSRLNTEFNTFQGTALLEPLIDSINTNGQLKAGTNIYIYRLFTENGQATEFSPLSESVKILDDSEGFDFAGGDISEVTDKSVRIKCNILNFERFNEIECVAIEYEAFGAPTSIRSLGIKSIAPIVFFDHFGNEAQFSTDITLSEILTRKNTWKYASDLHSKGNKLIASGLRNDPLPSALLNLNQDFTLHSWDINGDTHNCLINPKPDKYRYIDPTDNSKKFYVKKRLYNSIQVFNSFTIKLVNKETDFEYTISFAASSNTYKDYLEEINTWIQSLVIQNDFVVNFPNLTITFIQNKILFEPTDPLLETDISIYKFEYNTSQVIEDFEEEIQFKNLNVSGPLIYGAQSLGFNQGNGIQITYDTELVPILNKANEAYPADGPILKLETPDSKKGFFKGEIYRLGFQIFDKEGFQLFTIPLGDMQIPSLGEFKRYLDDNDQPVFENVSYANSRVIGDVMYAEKIVLKLSVRISCDIQKFISMYQLVYVERTANNRTILCQGLSAPLERVNIFSRPEYITLPDEVANKWGLPYYGGPLYDRQGLNTYDLNPDEDGEVDSLDRVVTNRSLIYFDSPEIIFGKLSDENIKNGFIQRVARLNPDNNHRATFNDQFTATVFGQTQTEQETFPSFSRKIFDSEIDSEDDRKSEFVNVSVFTERPGNLDLIPIDNAESLNYGEVKTGSVFNISQEISNNALTLHRARWFYSNYARRSEKCKSDDGAKSELFNSANYSPGYSTIFIKSDEDVFTDEFIAQSPIPINPHIRLGGISFAQNTHALINIKLNNVESVYGGRSELAYSQNVFVPLSKTVPVLQTSSNTQKTIVYGDTYVTLYSRNKNSYNDQDVRKDFKMNNSGSCSNKDEENGHKRNGAWAYAFVVESQIEPKWTDKDTFYKNDNPFDFSQIWSEVINEAYYQENTLRTFIPRPFNFKDDPNMGHIVAVSDTKLLGDYFDRWTNFKTNNFYELEKDKGVAYNIAKFLNNIYVVQERQTSILQIDENVMIPTTNGEVSLQQGNGEGVSNHQIISDFGTSIRRAIVEIVSGDDQIKGFSFIDEHRFEFLKLNQPLFIKNDLHLKIRKLFEEDPIVDTEGYFDDEYKETNIRVKTQSGLGFVISYNEKMNVFNGYIEYDNRIYMVWNENIYAPKKTLSFDNSDQGELLENDLHQLNKGDYLNFFDEDHLLKIGVMISVNPQNVKIFKHWAGLINIDYPISKMILKTNLNQERTILNDHYRYQIKEGRHSLPLKNRTDWDDLRGEWCELQIEVESRNNKKIDVFSFINFVRHSYQ